MGSLTLPASGLVYLDANPIIYTVEKHPVYGPLLVMREAACLRATTKLKTPDALHLATAQGASVALFVTNDGGSEASRASR